MYSTFRNASIATKVRLLFWAGIGIPFLTFGISFCVNDVKMIRKSQEHHMQALGQTISSHCVSVVNEDDRQRAVAILESLKNESEVDAACIFTPDKEVFATYRRPGYEGPIGLKHVTFDSFYTDEGALISCSSISFPDGAMLQLRANDSELQAQLNRITSIIIGIFLLCMMISTIVARVLQNTIVQPIVDMAKTSREISSSGDYSMRLNYARADELGQLNHDFNEMLKQIQHREEHLESLHQKLKISHEATLAASEAKSYFLANMSHEIRTPLTGILGFSDLLLKQGASCDEATRQDYLKSIHSSGCYLLNLINDILDLSKIEAQQMIIEKDDCSPHQIMAEVISMLRARALKKGISLELVWDSKVPATIFTDEGRFRQLLTNVIGNAVKFTESGGVTVLAEYVIHGGQSELIVNVIDTGIGIAADKLETIFDPFVQADNSVTRRFGGTGLGLAISRKMAQALDGDITIESSYDEGSTFTIAISAGTPETIELLEAAPSDAVSHLPTSLNNATAAFNHEKVLLAEDGATNRKLIGLLLEQAGLEVTTAENGQVAVRLAQKQDYDVILMDMQMPVMDGYRAATELRNLGIQIPIIALTAHAMQGDEAKCLEAGCSGYLTKPINEQRLIETISMLIPTAGQPVPQQKPPTSQNQSSSSPCSPESPTGADRKLEPITSTLPIEHDAFREIVEEFVDYLNGQLTELNEAFGEEDYHRVGELAHMIKGSGGTAGFEVLTIPARELDLAAEVQDLVRIQKSLAELQGLVGRISAGRRRTETQQS
ncbi:Autoinducer 2 sensor kinase/phosphatase LuxQ [Polystyrenella longa]|uniref:histidine kinase n=1 Tax=Polystyrenella longa TaxID=2528007 RepID=A0A518CM17_9PLAN|nr:response regulator [Polystyrenella longa]QDU80262.1 Autoinducer 2 sensor kinase/phosphatase LuxQ [Polystyrenella longa]